MFVLVAHTPAQRAAALAIRRAVFIDEQGVPEHEEIDDHEDEAVHLLALPQRDSAASDAIGTARLLLLDDATAKAQRVAVRAACRRGGVGRALMDALEDEARRAGRSVVTLGAQLSAVAFYERLGYVARGPVFLDAGIEHRTMDKQLGVVARGAQG